MHPHHNRYGATRGEAVVPGRLELPTSTLSVWRSNQLSYRTGSTIHCRTPPEGLPAPLTYITCRRGVFPLYLINEKQKERHTSILYSIPRITKTDTPLQKGGVPAAPSGTATLLRLSPNLPSYPRPTLAVTAFRHSRLSWLDGRCVQGPGTYSPRHG